jgi:hypothetical protein
MSQSECSCKNQNPDMLEDGSCICIDCKCHYYKRNDLGEYEDLLQQKIRNYGMVIMGTTTFLYGIYYFCCSNDPRPFISI